MLVPPQHAGSSEDAFKLLVNICDAVTAHFAPSPIVLQAEKLMERLILINKKRYVGSKRLAAQVIRDKVTNAVLEVKLKPAELLTMGVEIARRDNCLMVKESMEEVVTELLINRNEQAARDVLDRELQDLMAGTKDIGQLVITKAITREDYKKNPIQVEVCNRMLARDPSYEGGVGERICYIMVERPHRTLADQGEDPQWAIDHDLSVDVDYYIEHQLQAPMARLFMWLYINQQEKATIAHHESILRKLYDEGKYEQEEEYQDKILSKDLELIRKRVEKMLCGPGARAAFTRKVITGSAGIAKFFNVVKKCSRCKLAPACKEGRCKECQPGIAPCKASGCSKKLTDMAEMYCPECKPMIGNCASCGRELALVDGGVCLTCMDGACYSCGAADVPNLTKGACPKCYKFILRKQKTALQCAPIPIEELHRLAEEAKKECYTRCGRIVEDIKCVSKDCSTLYKRATIAARIRNYR